MPQFLITIFRVVIKITNPPFFNTCINYFAACRLVSESLIAFYSSEKYMQNSDIRLKYQLYFRYFYNLVFRLLFYLLRRCAL